MESKRTTKGNPRADLPAITPMPTEPACCSLRFLSATRSCQPGSRDPVRQAFRRILVGEVPLIWTRTDKLPLVGYRGWRRERRASVLLVPSMILTILRSMRPDLRTETRA
jgi:hypothetical protein